MIDISSFANPPPKKKTKKNKNKKNNTFNIAFF